jgi:hypothetical protein
MKWLARERVVPIISASVSWLTFAMIGWDLPSLPLRDDNPILVVPADSPTLARKDFGLKAGKVGAHFGPVRILPPFC